MAHQEVPVNTHTSTYTDLQQLFTAIENRPEPNASSGALGAFTLTLNGSTATFTRGAQPILTLTNTATTWVELKLGVTHAMIIATAAHESGKSNAVAAAAVANKYKY